MHISLGPLSWKQRTTQRFEAYKRSFRINAFHRKTQAKLEVAFYHFFVLQILWAVVVLQMRISSRVPHLVINAVHNSVEFLGQTS